MNRRIHASLCWVAVAFMALGLSTTKAQAQAPELGDEFIFFVNGPNVLIPEHDAEIVADPLDATSGNMVAKFNYGNWTHTGFRFGRTTGADVTQNLGDTLYLDLLSDPANAGQPNVWLMWTDKTDDSGANDGTADLEWRLTWTIPAYMHDGQWHKLAIPLPPATRPELDSLKAGKNLDGTDLAEAADTNVVRWDYPGAWSTGGFGVGPGFGAADSPLLGEFEWNAIKNFGIMFDNNTGGGPLYIDNMYIGGPNTDPTQANDPASAMGAISVATATEGGFDVTWSHTDGIGGYNVYASENPITDVKGPGVYRIGTVPYTADAFALNHNPKAPHPAVAEGAVIHYAVTTLSPFGVENTDISGSAGSGSGTLESNPYVTLLSDDQADEIFNNLSAGTPGPAGFPGEPFILDRATYRVGDVTVLPDDDADFSGKFWFGYTTNNELFMYGEIKDDVIAFGGPGVTGGDAWGYDSVEITWGGYTVPSYLGFSKHNDMLRGAEPDYQARVTGYVDEGGNLASTSMYMGWSIEAEVPGGGTAIELVEGGWNFVSLMPLDQIQNVDQGDVVVELPGENDGALFPFHIVYNDNDGEGRVHQVGWGDSPRFGANFWNTPAQWSVVAFADATLATGIDTETNELPGTFALEQNYPNPFNPATSIRFQLPQAAQVNLMVFDVLGRQVAQLVSNEAMTAGTHTVNFDASALPSGMYLYRIDAGQAGSLTRTMTLLK